MTLRLERIVWWLRVTCIMLLRFGGGGKGNVFETATIGRMRWQIPVVSLECMSGLLTVDITAGAIARPTPGSFLCGNMAI